MKGRIYMINKKLSRVEILQKILERKLNGKPAKIAPKLAARLATACDVPENSILVNSIAITPNRDILPYKRNPLVAEIVYKMKSLLKFFFT